MKKAMQYFPMKKKKQAEELKQKRNWKPQRKRQKCAMKRNMKRDSEQEK